MKLNTYQDEINFVKIKLDEIIHMKKYYDDIIIDCGYFKLFVINVRFGRTVDFEREKSQFNQNA